MSKPAGALLGSISAVGWSVAGFSVVAWVVGVRFGWAELLVVATAGVAALLIAMVFTLGRARLSVGLSLDPQRVVVGEPTTGRTEVTNSGARRMLPVRLEAAVGLGVARFEVPPLARGASWDDIFVIPTARRGIIPIGPVRSVRDDPLGLARREVAWTDVVDLYVHPRTTRLDGMTAGWIRDLEGRSTNDLSPSDVAFHTLREYTPGDDRRHVHWRTSARLGKLMVRQFVDTRRSHLGLVLSTSPGDYATGEEFELAVSVVGSLGKSVLAEDQAVTVTMGGHALPAHTPQLLLDGLAGVEMARRDLDIRELVRHALPVVRGVSVAVVVAGSTPDRALVRAAMQRFPRQVRVLTIRCRPGADVSYQSFVNVSMLEVGRLDDLARVLRSTVHR